MINPSYATTDDLDQDQLIDHLTSLMVLEPSVIGSVAEAMRRAVPLLAARQRAEAGTA